MDKINIVTLRGLLNVINDDVKLTVLNGKDNENEIVGIASNLLEFLNNNILDSKVAGIDTCGEEDCLWIAIEDKYKI